MMINDHPKSKMIVKNPKETRSIINTLYSEWKVKNLNYKSLILNCCEAPVEKVRVLAV